MRMTTKVRYGLRFMIYLGFRYNSKPVQLREVAEQEKISVKYLEQIIPYFRAVGLISSKRGTKGGYSLTTAPEKISLKDIIEPIEGDLKLVDCNGRDKNGCRLKATCAARHLWEEAGELVSNYFASTMLADLVKIYRDKKNRQTDWGLMFYI
ncbi:MAG TPA: Rrf2 family transcriptional regulator [Spirochaetota bacterium]|nr:Rrf2 family transcriptional regulator [Spirochaetota bacterium]